MTVCVCSCKNCTILESRIRCISSVTIWYKTGIKQKAELESFVVLKDGRTNACEWLLHCFTGNI